MKPGIHPNYVESTVTCACGNTFTTRSTRAQIRTDLCNVCHPFYTGEQRIVDTAGQVERFMRRVEAAAGSNRQSKRQQRIAARAERDAQSRRPADEAADGDEAEAAPEVEVNPGTEASADVAPEPAEATA